MTAPAFTPGPWAVKDYNHRGDGWRVEANGPLIAIACYLGGTDPAKVNAHLIAAAPDLYGALQTLVSMHIERGPFDEPLGSSEQEDEINVACAALRKARGGQA